MKILFNRQINEIVLIVRRAGKSVGWCLSAAYQLAGRAFVPGAAFGHRPIEKDFHIL